MRAPFWLFYSLYTGRSLDPTNWYQTIRVVSSPVLFWTEENSRSPVKMLFPLERLKSIQGTQWSACQTTVQDNQTAYPTQQVNPKKPKQLEIPSSHTAMPSFQQRSDRHSTPSHNFHTPFSAVLAQCQTTKRTPKNPFLLPCSPRGVPSPSYSTPSQSVLSAVSSEQGCTKQAAQISQHEAVSPILL